MAENDIKIKDLSEALQISDNAEFVYTQNNGGSNTTFKAKTTQLATKLNEGVTYNNLQTTSKTIVGAINEAAQGGGVEYATELPISSTDPTDTKSYIDTKTTLVKSASGSLIHITDGGDNIPLKSLESEIVAVQSGSGTPSPSNPRAISGFDSGKIGVTNDNIEQLWTIDSSFRGEVNFNQIVETSKKSATITPDGTQTYSVVGNRTSVLNVDDIYFIACTISYIGSKTLRAFCLVGSNGYGAPAQDLTGSSGTFGWILKPNSATSLSIGLSNIITSDKLTSADAWTYDNLMCINLTQMFGSTIAYYIYSIRQTTGVDFFRSLYPDVYYSYNVGTSELVGENTNTYTFAFGQTVYGGYFDNKGNLVVTHGYIASYNGEPINEPWISSMDNYVPNTSPSTGAQVVYPLTTPTTLSITSQDIPTLSGVNNIFSNCGDLDIEYFTSSADGLAALTREQPAPLHNYSLGEVEIGTWIDGSTLYEKTIQITSLSVGTATLQHGISNFDTLVSVSGRFTRADGKQSPISNVSTDTKSMVYASNFTDTSFVLFIGDNYQGATALSSMYLTIQYTKTT